MKKGLTEIGLVLDRSGSMASVIADAIGGVNTFLEDQKKEEGECHCTVVLFDNEYNILYNGVPIAQVEPFTRKTYAPRGSTALLDAVGKTITDIGNRLAITPEHERPEKVMIVIMTDGGENASKEFANPKIVADMIKNQTETYSWEFIFLSSDINTDANVYASSLNIHKASNFGTGSAGMKMSFASVNMMAKSYRGMDRDAYDLQADEELVKLDADAKKKKSGTA